MNTVQRRATAQASYGVGYLGQTHHGPVTPTDVINELTHRGYEVHTAPVVVHHVAPPAAPTLTKSMAISVAIVLNTGITLALGTTRISSGLSF